MSLQHALSGESCSLAQWCRVNLLGPTYVGVHYTRERGHLPPLLIGEVYLVDRVASSAHALVKATRPKGVEGRQKEEPIIANSKVPMMQSNGFFSVEAYASRFYLLRSVKTRTEELTVLWHRTDQQTDVILPGLQTVATIRDALLDGDTQSLKAESRLLAVSSVLPASCYVGQRAVLPPEAPWVPPDFISVHAAGLPLSLHGFAAEVAFPNYAQVPPLPPDVELDLLLWIRETAGK